jgi:Putative beta-barrel porin-2, OmpL-like. bbp2
MIRILTLLAFLVPTFSTAQIDSVPVRALTWSGYLETYYNFDFSNPANHQRPEFTYNHRRHNEVNLNLAFLKANYQRDRMRANLGLMAGNYVQYNLSAEPFSLQHIWEANVGVALDKQQRWWFDMGIMPSHLGFESVIGKDCPTLSRSLVAENSPYYQAGAKLSYTSTNQKFYAAALLLNGWQRIRRPDGNQTPALGSQITITPSSRFKLNWSTYIGNELPKRVAQWRFYNNIYTIIEANSHFQLTVGFDFGRQNAQNLPTSRWWTPVLIARYHKNRWATAFRFEHFRDNDGVLIADAVGVTGLSWNFDINVTKNSMMRFELRNLSTIEPFFDGTNNELDRNNTCVSMSLIGHF